MPFFLLARLIRPYYAFEWRFHARSWLITISFYLCFIAFYIAHSALVMEILSYSLASLSTSAYECFHLNCLGVALVSASSWLLPSPWVTASVGVHHYVCCYPSSRDSDIFGIPHTPRPTVGGCVVALAYCYSSFFESNLFIQCSLILGPGRQLNVP